MGRANVSFKRMFVIGGCFIMAQKETVERILDSAEALFAERGFAETSLRTITGAAQVNLAAVNYHFGSKKALIQAVFERFLQPLAAEVEKRLSELEASGEIVTVKSLLQLLADAIYDVHGRNNNRATAFMRLLGLAYTQSQAHLRNYMSDHYGAVFNRFGQKLQVAMGSPSGQDIFWHIHFALGAAIFTLSNFDALRAMNENEAGQRASVDFIVTRLTAFMAAGLESGTH